MITSQTFIPYFINDTNNDYVWVDIAGFGDTDGELIEYINTFIDKKIFNVAKEVKIIIPFTATQMSEQRGGIVAQLIKLMQNIFSSYLGQTEFSILPILTKVDPNDDEFDFDIFKDDFENVLKNELNN